MSENVIPKEEWRIDIHVHKGKENEELFTFHRYVDGKPIETYRHVGNGEAILFATHVILGFEPPRKLIPLNLPSR
jgi:hypothetical protein